MGFNRSIKVLMFGWEFPPFNSGGLGVACEGLVKALSSQGTSISFVLPKKIQDQLKSFDYRSSFCRFVFARPHLSIKRVDSLLSPYITSKAYQTFHQAFCQGLALEDERESFYSPDLFGEVLRYGQEGRKIAIAEDFDIIHAHDWLSFPAGIAAKKVSGKPLVVHIHATEFDRTGGNNVNQRVYEIEKQGFSEADKIFAVSNFTKNKIIQHYAVDPQKVVVVHNAIEKKGLLYKKRNPESLRKIAEKIVLFLGRITIQKGPDYFLEAAKKVLEKKQDVFFLIVGSGDMETQIIEKAVHLGIADKVLFAGFLRGDELARAYQVADLYILPSVSEPFGLTPLESLAHGTPVLISRQSGVSEVLSHCLKVDFWDINEMAEKILAVLEYPELEQALIENGGREVERFSWQNPARKCIKIYNELVV